MFELEGKVAIVTGASRGIGRACALALARQGAYVAVNYLAQEAAARETLEQIAAASGHGELLRFDVGDEDASRDAIRDLAKRRGGVDILVNNAGIARDELLVRMPQAEFHAILRTNLLGAFNCSKPAVALMMRKHWGRVVSLSSVVAHLGNPGQTAYAASKSALEGFTRALAREYGGRGITANLVAPGLIESDMTGHLGAGGFAAAAASIPVGRVGQPADVATVIAFLCSAEAAYVTGQVLAVNGGMYM